MSNSPEWQADESAIEQRIAALLAQMTLKEKVSLLSGKDTWRTVPLERLGLPSIMMTDGPHGVRANEPNRPAGPTTGFPTGVALAATWNPALIEQVGAALGEETRAMGAQVLLGPCVNIVRTPLAGRNFESYSEDPHLAGKIGAAWVRGLQSRQVGASLKHYACNNQEIERGRGNSIVDERALREIYLAQFEMVVKEAHPWSVMCSYNRINGVYASQNHPLLNEILKQEWGFDGVVVSDWGANHTIFESVAGGLDLEMPGPANYYGRHLVDAVNNWQIDRETVEEAARRVLRLVFRAGALDDPTRLPTGAVNTVEHQALARQAAEEAITLLKNEGQLLPLDRNQIKTIAVIGPNALRLMTCGGGSSFVPPPYKVNGLEGLRAQAGAGITIEYELGGDNFLEPPVLTSADLLLSVGGEKGVTADYFNNPDLEGLPTMSRIEDRTEHWSWGSPGAGVAEHYSARWRCQVTVADSGTYTLALANTGQCRLFLDDVLVLESAVQAVHDEFVAGRASIQISLTGGQAYQFRLEFVKRPDEISTFVKLMLAASPRPGEDDRIERAVALAQKADVAIVFGGMAENYESEGSDRPTMALPGTQNTLIEAVTRANPKTVVVLNVGSPVAMPWIDSVAAVLLAYYPGMEGGNAIARVLFGDVNPSGKLPVSFPKRLEDNPSFINYPGWRDVLYGEGLFVGYRYYDKKDLAPLFPFGHGLSYTHFEYSHLHIQPAGKESALRSEPALRSEVTVSLTVKNSGALAGQEVVQIYVADLVSSLARPPKELKAFRKIFLAAGESTTLTFNLDRRAFAFYDPYQKAWVAETGEFEILAGSSSGDIRASGRFILET